MKEFKVLAVSGQLGYGFPPECFYRGMERKPDLVGVDSGSMDAGPYYLGAGESHCDYEGIKRDLRIVLPEVRKAGVPFVTGSASTAGGEKHVQRTLRAVREICKEIGWNPKIAIIHAEIGKDFLKEKLARDEITPLDGAHQLTVEDIDDSCCIVGQMGIEPFTRALHTGADIIIAGRSCDTAIYAAKPIELGFDPGLCFHVAKIIECGAYCCSPGDGAEAMLATIRENDAIMETLSDRRRVLPMSVAAHTLYEQAHPSRFFEPDGMTDCSEASFEAYHGSDKAVRVYGTKFVPSEEGNYTLKIEGAAKQGYRTICVLGIRDKYMIEHLDEAIDKVKEYVYTSAGSPEEKGYRVKYLVYGRDAVMGKLEYERVNTHEICVVVDVLGKTQEQANTICALNRSNFLHVSYPNRKTTGGNVAIPFSPHDIPVGPVYRFSVYHIVHCLKSQDFKELFPVEIVSGGM